MTTARPRRSLDGRRDDMSYPPVSPCRSLADVLPLDYLTPEAEAWLPAPGPGCHSGADGRRPAGETWGESGGGEYGSCAARCVACIRGHGGAGQRGGDPRSTAGRALRRERSAIGARRRAGRLGSRYRRAVADAGRSGDGRGSGPARAGRVPRDGLRGDRPGMHIRHAHRTCHPPASVLVTGGRSRDRPQRGGLGRPHRSRSVSSGYRTGAAAPRWVMTFGRLP